MPTVARSNANRRRGMARSSAFCCLWSLNMKAAHILLIEDDTRAAASLERLLKTESYAVTVAHRGDDGLRLAKTESFDVVVTDLKMPGVDGLEVIKQMHAAQ